MLINEAKWLGQNILKYKDEDIFPVLNIGSSDSDFRDKKQPWINKYIFNKLILLNKEILHLDCFVSKGIDIIDDINSLSFQKNIRQMLVKSVLCSSLLEHVENKEKICSLISEILPKNGYLFVSCPYSYPYHPSPIDTMFRPDISELKKYFPEFDIISSSIITDVSHFQRLKEFPLTTIKNIFTNFVINTFFKSSVQRVSYEKWVLKKFQAVCLVLKKL